MVKGLSFGPLDEFVMLTGLDRFPEGKALTRRT